MEIKHYENLSHKEVADYHKALREEIYEDIENEFSALSLKVKEITIQDAIEANSWKQIWQNPKRVATWDWVRLYNEYGSRSAARRFDIAVRRGGQLLCLCYGMLERNRLILRLHALERSPLKNPVSGKVVDLVLYAANLYAEFNGTSEIWLCDPVSPAHIRLYEMKGYQAQVNWFGTVTHLTLRLK